jgi:GT2 family glycosyltransferase
MGFAVSVCDHVGLFDESELLLLAAEDNDWSYRALRMGVPIIYAPEVIVKHLDWRSESQLIATYQTYARSQGAFYGKHLAHGDLFIALRVVITLLRAFWRWSRGIITSNTILVGNGRAFVTELLPGLVKGSRGRR